MLSIRTGRILALTAALLLCRAAAADDVHLWIRAFVPDTVVGFSDFAEVIGGNAGISFVRASDGGCLATDRRVWSDAVDATSRLSSDFHLLIDGDGAPVLRATGKQFTAASAVRSIDCVSGADLASTAAVLLADEVGAPTLVEQGVQVAVLAAIADPQRPWSSATIHYDARFTYNRQSRTLEYQASTGSFPAYEAYATLNGGPVITIFRSGPIRRTTSDASTKGEASSVTLTGSVNLNDPGKRPKAPTNLTVQ